MDPALIFDVGMHEGDDTAHYLAKGFRVVAVEASPDLVSSAQRRFASELVSGRLQIVSAAVAEDRGDIPLFMFETRSQWNTTDRRMAENRAIPFREISVPGLPFREILEEHGVPLYLKVDIEGRDHLCLEALRSDDLPAYVSFEWSADAMQSVEHLALLGYDGFKLISQENFLPMEIDPAVELRTILDRELRTQRIASLAHRALAKRRGVIAELGRPRARPTRMISGTAYPVGGSGPFGEDTLGEWQSHRQITSTLVHFTAAYDAGEASPFWPVTGGRGPWADIHARLAGVG